MQRGSDRSIFYLIAFGKICLESSTSNGFDRRRKFFERKFCCCICGRNCGKISIKAPVSTWSRSPELKVQLWKTAVNRDSFESSTSIPSQVYREKRNGNVVIFIRRLVFKVRRREQCLLSPDCLDTSFVRFLFATTRLENSKRREENFLSLIFEYIEKRRCLNFV